MIHYHSHNVKKIIINIFEIIVFFLLLSLLFYFDFISDKTFSFLKLMTILLTLSHNGYHLGKSSSQRSIVTGVIYGLSFVFICFVSIFLLSKFQVKFLIYFLLIIMASVLGSTFGSKKMVKKKD